MIVIMDNGEIRKMTVVDLLSKEDLEEELNIIKPSKCNDNITKKIDNLESRIKNIEDLFFDKSDNNNSSYVNTDSIKDGEVGVAVYYINNFKNYEVKTTDIINNFIHNDLTENDLCAFLVKYDTNRDVFITRSKMDINPHQCKFFISLPQELQCKLSMDFSLYN